jgi:Fe-S-cluster containining protein
LSITIKQPSIELLSNNGNILGARYTDSYEICVNQCGGKCCKTGNAGIGVAGLTITTQEMRRLKQLNKKAKISSKGSKWLLDFKENGGQCPFLSKDNLCTIHDDRPDACRKYPLWYEPKCLLSVNI